MNVKSVSEKTGLTRRAIKYYEKEGLINPKKNEENNYREFTNEDITKLNLIAALRMLDIPIPNIKEVIQGEKPLNIIMKKTLNDIEKNIQELQKNKSIINHLLDKSIGDIYEMSSEVKNLRETLEYSTKMKKQYIYEEFMRIFPGAYGEVLALIYEPFLNVRVDTEEKKSAWIKLIEDLDADSIIDENHPYLKLSEDFKVYSEVINTIRTDVESELGIEVDDYMMDVLEVDNNE
ncbi:MerR family transcriptional regulator [Oceanirhabdus sp. W0125-5]|uniref:MerR family transcriptional regulator n=1 Tax=Oceanirhabdus sp. W0125-5 TaxID=2999116 RepID=UPI0022F2CAC5|nr:MerR family transcriptional regulator [Oceanirhabdus sp. W0125-5]WBW98109.1 MerR family transcriptional regulator [Oceanirhabdus sp. W0125-5]